VDLSDLSIKIKKAYREGGISEIGKRARKKSFRTNCAYWYSIDLKKSVTHCKAAMDLNVQRSDLQSVAKYLIKKDLYVEEEMSIAAREGHLYYLLSQKKNPCGFCKVGLGRIYIHDFRQIYTIPKNAAFIIEYEVDESLRGMGVAKFLISRVLFELQEMGFEKVLCHIPPWNVASMKVMEHCSFNRKRKIRFVEILHLKFHTVRFLKFLQE